MSIEDGMIRQQVLLEGLKSYQSKISDKEITLIFDIYISYFSQLKSDEFVQLTRAKLNSILKELRKKAISSYANYSNDFLNFLKKFVDVEIIMTATIIKYKALEMKRNPLLSSFDRNYKNNIWSNLLKEVMPSDGSTLKEVIDYLGSSIITTIENSLHKAVANLQTFSLWYDSIVGSLITLPSGKRARSGGLYNKHINNARSMIATVIQHASSYVQSQIQSKFFDKYYWRSIMDNRTTEICSSRNGSVYVYGEGPLPPAHRWCRSRIVPVDGKANDKPKNFLDWLKNQPKKFIKKIMNSDDIESLTNENLDKFKPYKDFDLNQYKNGLELAIE